MTDQTKSLLAELDAEFGKAARKPQRANGRGGSAPEPPHRGLNRVFHQRSNTGDYRDEVAYANAASRDWAAEPGWQPRATVHRVHHQHCRMCTQTVSYVANEFTRMRNDRLRLRLDVAQLHTQDELGFPLPQHVETHHVYVEMCAGCLALTRRVDELAECVAAITGQPMQQPLFQ
jgi:hypothetical protein